MTPGTARRLAWAAFGLWLVFLAGALGMSIVSGTATGLGRLGFTAITAAFPVVGIVILARQPRNRVGWILLGIGIAWVIPIGSYGDLALAKGLPGGAASIAVSGPLWAPPIGLMGTFLILRFPDGRLLSPWWRKVEWLSAVAIVATVVIIALHPGKLDDSAHPGLVNPLGVEGLKPLLAALQEVILLIPASIIASAVSLVLRFRRSRGLERLQVKWLATAAAFFAAAFLVAMIASIRFAWAQATTPFWIGVLQGIASVSFLVIPVSIGFAVLRYRLYDIDLVINKTLVYGVMAGFISAVYVAIVVGVGRLVGSGRDLGLSILATALVAVAFQPVRERVQRVANRVVYGRRASPYEVLSEFSGGMARAVATEELLPRMARVAAEAVGAAGADVWLRVGSELVREASWPQAEPRLGVVVSLADGPDPTMSVPEADLAIPVWHQGQLLGVIGVRKSAGEQLSPGEAKLLRDLASQAGLVLRNVRLIEELRTSRQRLVSAQDQERRRLERDLHDGAQQRLVAVSLALRMARMGIDRDKDADLEERLELTTTELALALAELREFARGVHPAILTERGLVAGLRSLAERSTVATTVQSGLDRRLPAPVEAAAYFVASEALANVAKYANATSVTVCLDAPDGVLTLDVADDGIGGADPSRGSGLRGLGDRVAAVDGTLDVDSPAGNGTRLTARIPIPALMEASA